MRALTLFVSPRCLESPRKATSIWCGLSFHIRPSMELPFVCLAAHDSKLHRWTPAETSNFCCPPAEPGELPCWFRARRAVDIEFLRLGRTISFAPRRSEPRARQLAV